MLRAGYHCQYVDLGPKGAPRLALGCGSGHPVKAATFVVGYNWAYDFYYNAAKVVTDIQIVDGYYHGF